MREPDVTLTDYGLAAECALFAVILVRRTSNQFALRRAAACFFFFLGLSAATGGTVHGFCSTADSGTCASLWVLTLLSVGLASASLWVTGAMLHSQKAAKPLALLAVPLLIVYGGAVLLVTQQFWIAFTAYLPAMLLLSFGFLKGGTPLPRTWRLIGVGGIAISLVSCAIQYLKVGVHPVYLTHNALAHVIQGIAMALLFVTLQHATSAARIA